MKIKFTRLKIGVCYFIGALFMFTQNSYSQQTIIRDYVIYSANGSHIGSSITINGGSVGSQSLVQSTGTTVFNSNIYSGNKINITNSNTIKGKIAAANSSALSGNILSVGSNAVINGNIDVKGDIIVSGGTVSGRVTHPAGTIYSGPVPTLGEIIGPPELPILPVFPVITTLPMAGTANITNNRRILPGAYGEVILGSNKSLTLEGPGIYVFKSFLFTGNSTKIIFDFKNTTSGNFIIYVHGNADLGKLNASTINGGGASRIYFEVHGNGISSSIPGYSFIIANGSSGSGSKSLGTIYAPFAGINIGSGTGSSDLSGAFFSKFDIMLQSGVTVNYVPFGECVVPNAGVDQIKCGSAPATLAANAPGEGSGSWSVVSGPSTANSQFSNLNIPSAVFTPIGGTGLYTLRWTINSPYCAQSFDDVDINFKPLPTNSNAGPDQTEASTCGLTSVTLSGNTPTIGSGLWTIVSGDGGTIATPSNPVSAFNGVAGATYTLRWTITNSPCPVSTDDVIITFNQNPQGVSAGPDKALAFAVKTKLTGTSTTPGVSFSWQAIKGGIIDTSYTSPNNDTIKGLAAGTYILTVTSAKNCISKDTVLITGRLKSIIGSELQSIYDNDISDTTFFLIEDGFVLIDVIAIAGLKNSVATLLMNDTATFGLRDTITNGSSQFIITGFYPVSHLPNLNTLITSVNYARPHYIGRTNSGLVNSAGDTTVRSYLVRKGYNMNGDSIKIGVLSDSYATITSGATATLPLQPFPPGPQTFNINTAAKDVSNGDLPGDTTFAIGGHVVNPSGFTKNVHVLKDYPFKRTDEGRAMLQIIHDLAPGSELYFRTGLLTAGDFATGIYELQNAGCIVIVDDITYPTEPFLKDGIVAKAVDSVVKMGTSYFSSAGNFARQSYEKDFNSVQVSSGLFEGIKAHDFGTNDIYQQIKLAPGNYLFVIQWVDNIYSTGETAGTRYDLDIYLSSFANDSSVIGYNRDNTDGDPIEFVPITILPGSDSIFNVLIVNNTTFGNPERLKYIVFRDGHKMQFIEYNEGISTIIGHANADSAITVGAARFDKAPPYLNPPVIQPYSSTGGTKTHGVIRNKPDIVAPDGVNTTVKMGQDFPNNALDGFSNFFGTSATAPHAAATAALIIQGKKKFLDQATTPSHEIRTLMKNTAIDMEAPGFDFNSGHGLINIDKAMRTFAAPTPSLNKLIIPGTLPITIPGNSQFTLTVKGDNFSANSVLYFRDSALASTIVLDTINGIATAVIPTFTDNPPISMYTPPYPTTNGKDGGFSDSLYFFEKNITIRVDSLTKKYGEQVPTLTAKIYVDDVPLANTSFTLDSLGLGNMIISSAVNANSNVGTDIITAAFDPANPPPDSLLQKYKYTFIQGLFTVEKLPLIITVQDTTVTYGDLIPNIQFSYQFDSANIANPSVLLNTIHTEHQSQLARDANGNDVLGLVNGQAITVVNGQAIPVVNGQAITVVNGQAITVVNGQAITVVNGQALTVVNGIVTDTSGISLSSSDKTNLSFLASETTLQNTRQINNQKFVNGNYVPATTNIIDLTQESILDYNVNAAQTQMLNSVSNVNSKGMVDIESYLNGQAITVVNGQAITVVNGQAITVVNGQAVTVVNGQAVTVVNGQIVPIISSTNRTAVIIDTTEIGQGISPLKSINIISGLSVGEQFILPGAFTNSNFQITNIEGKLIINKAPLQVKADNKLRPFGEDNPSLTTTYTGFVYGENLQNSRITGTPVVSTTATITSPVSPPTYPITISQGTLASSNYAFNFVNGVLTVTNNPCILTHSAFKNFGNTPVNTVSLWLNMETKISGQLVNHGDYLLFKSGTVTFNNINSTPLVNNRPIPDGRIIADSAVSAPVTSYDTVTNTWITKIPPGYPSTSDIFVTGAIINSSNGFVKANGNTSSVLKGIFYSNRNFSDQWAYGIAAYMPQFAYTAISNSGQVASINGTYRAGTPIPIITNLVNGGSGGGGNNYTGSSSAFDNFTACIPVGSLVNRQSEMLSINDVTINDLNEDNVRIIPNPASGHITIQYMPKYSGNSRVEIYSLDGRKHIDIGYGIAQAGKVQLNRVDISSLINGVYIVRLLNESAITTKKIIIHR